MIDTDSRIEAEDLARFPSLASLKAANNELLKQRRDTGDTREFLARIEAFLARGQATGAILDADDDRWATQSILDYWSNFLVRAGCDVPDVALADFDPALAPELDDSQCPYLGLRAFPEDKQGVFFGRQRLVQAAVDYLKENRFLAVIGPSGSGKSSMILAGLLPALKSGILPGSQGWRCYPPIVPGSDPLSSLIALTQTSPSTGMEQAQQIERFRNDDNSLLRLIKNSHAEPAVIIVDQFEEVFTLCIDDGARKAFINNLIKVAQSPDAAHIVIVTMRSDFEDYVAKLPELQMLFDRATIRMTSLSAPELREAIEKPAEIVGLRFESGVVDQLIKEVLGEPAGLPLLQFTLLKLWERRQHNLITWEAFHELGSCREALTRSADSLYNRLIPESQVTLKRILLRLVRPGEGLEVFSKRVRRDELDQIGEPTERVERVLNELIKEGLVRRTGGDTPGDEQIEIAHEALIRNWPRLVAWLEEERVSIRRRLRLADAAREWDASGRERSALLRGAQLDEALRYDDLSELERLFVEKSRNQQKRAKVIFNSLAVGAIIVMAILVIYSYRQRNLALEASEKAFSRQLAAQALNPPNKRLDLALLLSLEAISVNDTVEARSSLLSNLQQSRYLISYLRGLNEEPLVLAFDAEGKTLASANKDKTINTWNVDTPQLPAVSNHPHQLVKAAFSPKLKTLAIGSQDGRIFLWNVATRQLDQEIKAGERTVKSVAFSHNGKVLAASCNGPTTIALWEVKTEQEDSVEKITGVQKLTELPGHEGATVSLAFDPSGKILASGSADGSIMLWDRASYQLLKKFEKDSEAPDPNVTSLAFSSDGKILASAGPAGINLWDLNNYKNVYKQRGKIESLAFDPKEKGYILATGSDDGTIILWDLRDLLTKNNVCQIDKLIGHSGSVSTLAFSPDGKLLVSGGSDKSAILWNVDINIDDETLAYICERRRRGDWDVNAVQRLGTPLIGEDASFLSVAFSPDGKFLAAETDKNTIILWDAVTLEKKEELKEIAGPTYARVGSLALSPDGKTLAATNGSNKVLLWDITNKRRIDQPIEHSEPVTSLAFSPDGKILASGSVDKTVILWDVNEWKKLRELKGHSGSVNSVAFSPDRKLLASGSADCTVALWDVQDTARNSPIETFKIREGEASYGQTGVMSVAFSLPDGKILASGNWDNTINLWDVASRKPLGLLLHQSSDQLIEDASYITYLAFSPDGKTLASGSTDNSIILWDVDTRLSIGRFLVPTEADPASLSFGSDGARLASSYRDKNTIYLWDVSLESWKKRACPIANRKLGPREWERIMGDRPYRPACDNFPSLESTP